jgi:hypothetical protein
MQIYHNETIYDPVFPRPVEQRVASKDPEAQIKDKNSEWAIESRSILRAILRECTYLPDPQAREFVRQQALAGFRKWIGKAWRLRTSDGIETRLMQKRRDARSTAKELHRANQGETPMLRRFLMATYGRVGKRRWELLEPLLGSPEQQHEFLENIPDLIARKKEQELADANSGKSAQAPTKTRLRPSRETKDAGQPQVDRLAAPHPLVPDIASVYLPTQLRELIRSQRRNYILPVSEADILVLQPPILAQNYRGHPMPISRVRNSVKDWYNDILSGVLPPLHEDEWNRLRDLANTTRRPDEVLIPRRRGPATDTRPMSMLELVVSGTKFHQGHFENRNAKNITPRAMQRIWADVFRKCPLMSKKDEDQYWTITWGGSALEQPRPASKTETSP